MSNTKANTILIAGDMTIQNASSIKQKMLQELQKTSSLKIEWGEIESIDVAGIQLIHSLVKTADAQEKTLDLSLPLPQVLQKFIKEGGFSYLNWTTE